MLRRIMPNMGFIVVVIFNYDTGFSGSQCKSIIFSGHHFTQIFVFTQLLSISFWIINYVLAVLMLHWYPF